MKHESQFAKLTKLCALFGCLLCALFAILVWGALPVFLITSIFAAGVDCCFILMQRYNRPRLQQYLKRSKTTPDRRQPT